MLFSFLDAMIVLGIGALVLTPLLYALATLRGMRHKRVYPILRVKRHDGRVSLVQESDGGPNELRAAVNAFSNGGAQSI